MPSPDAPPADGQPAAQAVATPALRQRDPPIFAGTGSQDVEEWLDAFERSSKHNRWDGTLKLNNVVFYLTELAKTWFINHETEITSWDTFRTKITDLFGRPTSRKADAQARLERKMQLPSESYTSYIEDVLSLCARIDPRMTESDKVKHIRKGISRDAFHLLLLKSPATVEETVKLCRDLQEAQNARVQPSSLDSVPSYLGPSKIEDLRVLIRQLIREELARNMDPIRPASLSPPTAPSLQAMIREEVSAAVTSATAPTASRPTYAEVVRGAPQMTMPHTASEPDTVAPVTVYSPPPSLQAWQARNSAYPRRVESRTCFFCGIRGHIARNCRKRLRQLSYASSPTYWHPASAPAFLPSNYDAYYQERDDDFSDRRADSRGGGRTPRRRSLSPQEGLRRTSPFRGPLRSPAREGNP